MNRIILANLGCDKIDSPPMIWFDRQRNRYCLDALLSLVLSKAGFFEDAVPTPAVKIPVHGKKYVPGVFYSTVHGFGSRNRRLQGVHCIFRVPSGYRLNITEGSVLEDWK